jgi:HAD superfamily hydrolase (TIGR01509 family)
MNDRAILFDFGDTLVHFGDVDKRALFQQGAWRTYQMWAARNRRMPDYRRFYLHHWFGLWWGYLKTLVLRRELDAMRLIRRACRKLWLQAPGSFFEELAWNWYKPLAEIARVDPDTATTLTRLREEGWKLGLVSNTFVPGFVLDRHLRELGLIEFFPVRIYSCDVGYRKPDRRIFDIALQRMEVPPAQAVFIGDLLDADIQGAQRAGLHAVWFCDGRDVNGRCEQGSRRIRRLAELRAHLDELFASSASHESGSIEHSR